MVKKLENQFKTNTIKVGKANQSIMSDNKKAAAPGGAKKPEEEKKKDAKQPAVEELVSNLKKIEAKSDLIVFENRRMRKTSS